MIVTTTGTQATVVLGSGDHAITLTHPETYNLVGDDSIWDEDDLATFASDVNAALTAGSITAETEDGDSVSSISVTTTPGIQEINGKTGAIVSINTDDVAEGSTNLFHTAARAAAAAPVQSVNGGTGNVTVTTFSGNYNDLSNKPTLGTAADNDETDFASAAQGGLADSAVQPGDNVSALNNNAGYINASQAPVQSVNGNTGNVVVPAFSGDYNDLTNKPTLGTAADNDEGDFATSAQGALADSALQPGGLDTAIAAYLDRHSFYKSARQIQNSTSFTDYIDQTFNLAHSGTYRVTVMYWWSTNDASNDFVAQLMHNGSRVGNVHQQEPKDTGGDFDQGGVDGASSNQRHATTISAIVSVTSGNNQFELQFKPTTSNDQAAIYKATLFVERWI